MWDIDSYYEFPERNNIKQTRWASSLSGQPSISSPKFPDLSTVLVTGV